MDENINNLAQHLERPVIHKSLSTRSVFGYYKNRKAGLAYSITGTWGNGYDGIYMEPNCLAKKQPIFMLWHPKPTRRTFLRNNKIYYTRFTLRGSEYHIEKFEKAEIAFILEELTHAVEIVKSAGRCVDLTK